MTNPRRMDSLGGIALVLGSILGSGIFVAPSLIAAFSQSLWVTLAFWGFGGLVCTAGAVIYGSLGLQFPQGGGQYVFLRETLGPRYSTFYGWLSMAVICPVMVAGMALFFVALCKDVWPVIGELDKPVALGLLIIFTFINSCGLRLSSGVQKAMVLTQIVLFLSVIGLSFTYLPGRELGAYIGAPFIQSPFSLGKGILALAAVLWSFEGFNSITFLTNEVEDGDKNVRRIALTGCVIVIILYLLFNSAALANIPPSDLVTQTNAASYLVGAVFGTRASWIVFALTILGVANVLHASLTIGPRVIAATVSDRKRFTQLARVHPRTGAPNTALWFQCAVAGIYVLIGHFDSLMTTFIVLNWIFYGLVAIGYLRIRNRIRRSSSERWRDGVTVGVFLAMVVLLLASQVIESPWLAIFGLVAFLMGVYGPRGRMV